MKINIQNSSLKITAGTAKQFPHEAVPQIAFSGRSNVGKSSLVNSLLGRKSLARVSSTPGKTITVLGETFKWNILGYDTAHGGLPYFCAYMVAMVVGECINFPIQRSLVFRSKGNIWYQILWYVIAFCVITCIVNSINCIWVAVAGKYVASWLYNIGTTVLNGGVSMVIFFFVNKIIFPERQPQKEEG